MVNIFGWLDFLSLKRLYNLNFKNYIDSLDQQTVLNAMVYIVGIFGPFMTLPQIWQIYGFQNTAGISLITWGSYSFVSMVWLWYAIYYKQKPLIISSILWICMYILVIYGAVIY